MCQRNAKCEYSTLYWAFKRCVMMQQALSGKYCFCINLWLKSVVAYKHSALIWHRWHSYICICEGKQLESKKLGNLPKAKRVHVRKDIRIQKSLASILTSKPNTNLNRHRGGGVPMLICLAPLWDMLALAFEAHNSWSSHIQLCCDPVEMSCKVKMFLLVYFMTV